MARNGKSHTATTPYWLESPSFPEFDSLNDDLDVDVAVVGGGLTGLTAAYLLATAGKSVVVLERERCAGADTAHTSAHLTMVTDRRLSELALGLGRTHAQAVWDAGLAALSQIDDIVRDHEIDCAFAWVDGYLHAPSGAPVTPEEINGLRADAALAQELGFDASFLDHVPFVGVPGVRFDNQARLHIRNYLAGLARAVRMRGGEIFEHSPAQEFHDDPLEIRAKGGRVRCKDIVIATHSPLQGLAGTASAALFQTKLALYTSYVVGARVPKGTVPDALFWDTAATYHYLRLDPQADHDLIIFGGEDHKTGQEEHPTECIERLEERLRAQLPEVDVHYRWSGQVIDTPDGLPYIGAMADHQYAATGFNGNGITFGTLGAMMIADAILGRANPWVELFDPGRKAVSRGAWRYLKENADYPYYMVRDRFAGAESRSLRSVKRGQGQVIVRDGEKVAAYRDRSGALIQRSATCTHMGCVVAWNDAEGTWDCPCHGSRFSTHGDVIAGPAESPLPPAGEGDQA